MGPNVKELFMEYVKNAGYTSMKAFAKDVGVNSSNILKNIKGIERPQFLRLFAYAQALHVPLQDLLCMFYPEEMENLKNAL